MARLLLAIIVFLGVSSTAYAAEEIIVGERGGVICTDKKAFDLGLKQFLAKKPINEDDCALLEAGDELEAYTKEAGPQSTTVGRGKSLVIKGWYVIFDVGAGPAGNTQPVDMAVSPKRFIGKTVVLSDVPCVSDPKAGFKCVLRAGGRFITINASVLGAAASLEAASHLVKQCTGTINIDQPECHYDIRFTVTSAAMQTLDINGKNLQVGAFWANSIDMWRPKH